MHACSISSLIQSPPYAEAFLKGSRLAPNIGGSIRFYPWADGTIVKAEITNLPEHRPDGCGLPRTGPFELQIDRDSASASSGANNRPASSGVFRPVERDAARRHPDGLPALFSNNGYAYMVVYTNRFKPKDIIGAAVLIRQSPEDQNGPRGDPIARGSIGRIS